MLNISEEIKQLFRQSSTKKNIRIHFPNGEREDITNSNLISESFSFTESICSQDTLKFGLCEASMVEFETFNIGNIKDCTIEITLDVLNGQEWYPIPMGTYVVDSCEKQSNMTRRRVVAYTKNKVQDYKYSELENLKRSFPVPTNEAYNINLYNFLASNTPGMIPEGTKTLLEYETSGSSMDIATDNLGKRFHMSIMRDTWNFEGDAMKKLYYIEVQNDKTLEKKINDAIDQILPYWKNTSVFSQMKKLDKKECNISYYVSDEDGNPNTYDPYWWEKNQIIKDSACYYPYVSDTEGISSSISWITRITVSIYDKDGVKEFSTTLNSEGALNVYQIDKEYNSVDNFVITIPRTKTKVEASMLGQYKTGYIVTDEKLVFQPFLEAYTELNGRFGKIGRNGEFDFISLKSMIGLYPSETLYPSNNLYPSGNDVLITKTMYKHPVWYDDTYTLLYSKVTCTYKNSETNENTYAEHVIVEVEAGEEDKYQTYDISDNYLIKENTFTEEQITEILSNIALNIEGVRYMPADIDLIGLPYLEAGDVVRVITTDGGFETIILNRTLSGIQRLNDNYESRG